MVFHTIKVIEISVGGIKWDKLGPLIAKMRTKGAQKLYEEIGGGSPILEWTEIQDRGMGERLDRLSPNTAPHEFYVAFRYTHPTGEDALLAMKRVPEVH